MDTSSEQSTGPMYPNPEPGSEDMKAFLDRNHPQHQAMIQKYRGGPAPTPMFKGVSTDGTTHELRDTLYTEARTNFTTTAQASVGLHTPDVGPRNTVAEVLEHIDPLHESAIAQRYGLNRGDWASDVREQVDLREAATAQALLVGHHGVRPEVASEAIGMFVHDLVNLRTWADAEREGRAWATRRRLTADQTTGMMKMARAFWQQARGEQPPASSSSTPAASRHDWLRGQRGR